MSATAGRSTSITSADLAARLRDWLASERGADVEVEGLERLAGGASRELWVFDAVAVDGTRQRLVLRRDPPGHVVDSSRSTERKLLDAARAAGVPVPAVRGGSDDVAVLGSTFFVMDYVGGETIARRLLRDEAYAVARDVLPEQLASALASIHRLDPGVAPELAAPAAGVSPAAAELDRFDGIYRAITPDPHPALELAFRWLGRRLPPPTSRPTLVHGDFRVGNVIVGGEGLRAVLDWELAHVGDPMEDLGWFCVRSWRFGADDRPAGGLCSRERFFAAYAAASGRAVDPDVVRWWEVYGNLRWAIMTIMQAHAFLSGVASVELASLGRRTCEMELELLDLMEA